MQTKQNRAYKTAKRKSRGLKISTAALSGAYIGLKHYSKFSFGCAICNKLLIILLGFTGVMTYFMPIQPVLGILSVALLAYAVYAQSTVLRKR